jgi:hypothetical protein
MTHESTLVLPVAVQVDKALFAPAHQSPAPVLENPSPDAEQVRALEAVFTAKDQESETVAGLFGLVTGTLVLHDLAVETFSEPAGEVEAEEEPKEKDKPKDI